MSLWRAEASKFIFLYSHNHPARIDQVLFALLESTPRGHDSITSGLGAVFTSDFEKELTDMLMLRQTFYMLQQAIHDQMLTNQKKHPGATMRAMQGQESESKGS